MRSLAPTSTYRPRAIHLHGPGGPPPIIGRTRDVPPLVQFVFLSMLLHVLAIMLFGAPSGGSREGRALWGSLQVVLQPPQPVQPSLKVERSLGGLRVPAKRREEAPRRERAPAPVDLGVSRQIEPSRLPEPARIETAPIEEPLFVPQFLDRIVTPEPKYDLAPPLRLPAPTESQVPRPPVRERAPAGDTAPAAPEIQSPAPTAPPVAETPRAPVIEIPVMPNVERVPTVPNVERLPAEAPAIAAPLPKPAPPPPVEAPAIPVAPLESVAPPRIDVPAAADKPPLREAPAVDRSPPPLAPPREAPRTLERAPVNADEAAARPSPFREPPPSGAPRGDAPSNFDPTAPSVDLDAMRKRAGQIAREGSGNRALLPFPMPAPAERKTKMETAIENARKPDCRTAYQSLGLAAVVPLIANQFGEGNCRW